MGSNVDEKISVIIPVYNTKEYLEKCVSSVTSQTYKNLEIFLVDDGSTDGSDKLCDRLAQDDSRIRVIHKANSGASDARNAALDVATGEIITFVDSDDYIDDNMYEELMKLMREYDADIVSCAYRAINGDDIQEYTDDSVTVFKDKEMFAEYIRPTKGCMPSPAVWNKIYKRHIFDGLRFIKGRIYEDKDMSCQVLSRCKTGVFVSHAYYNYIYRQKSASHLPMNVKSADDFVYMYRIQLDMVKKYLDEKTYTRCMEIYYMLLLDSFCRVYKRDKAARELLATEMRRVKSEAKPAVIAKKSDMPKRDFNLIMKSFSSPYLYYYMNKIDNKLHR
ncbi:glycosyltransferase [Falcatimonas sp. MSJ-15]|uniref:glycosyltransferase family 2 protein n=1 Tax=Falcatimonas sp. MSJ-15 TaxID=2841515 RepID=UPI001C0FF1BF|nr:glycosyltransferase [Falcatimonas sp. MSJ-15]MBU5469499.1 glycosyltransferase [Falcatimonas sp. MSJ-15]